MPLRRPLLSRQRGVALLLLVVMGGIGGALLMMSVFRPQAAERRNEQQTHKRLADAREALIGFAARNGRLPRPARSALDGRENPQPCDTVNSCSGFIPWVTLGIEGADSWGKLLRYAVTPSFTVVPIDAITVGGDKTVSGRDGQGKLFYLVGQPGCPVYVQCAPAVLYSSGKNNPGTSVLGIALPSPVDNNLDERQNDIASSDFISRPRGDAADAPGGEFDDLVTWVPVQKLYSSMRAAHTLK